jgi:uncharacterized protein (TIGR00730 family)
MELPPEVERNRQAILRSPGYRKAEIDIDFLGRAAQRPIRMQLELHKVETLLRENKIDSTVVVFGGTQIVEKHIAEERLALARQLLVDSPRDAKAKRAVIRAESVLAKTHFYNEAREFARLVSSSCQSNGKCNFVIATGGGPGIMEAANRGAFEIGARSIGFNIELPHEQEPNPYITPELCFQFNYFALRKFHFVLRAAALVVFPGGFGTLDELFNTLTLRQTGRMQEIPIILYGKDYWQNVINFSYLADQGVVADDDVELCYYADTPADAWKIIADFHHVD